MSREVDVLLFPLPSFVKVYGPLGVSSLTLSGVAGTLAGRFLTSRVHRRAASAFRETLDLVLGPLLLGLLAGARLFNQFAVGDLVWYNPFSWVRVTGYSLSFTGGLVGAVVAVLWFVGRRREGSPLAILDALAPGAALAVAIGWLGVPVLGRITHLPWALPVGPGVGIQPVQLYGFLGFAAIAAALSWQSSRMDYVGQNFISFVLLMAAFRFLLGFTEQTPAVVGPWSLTQLADAGTVLMGLGLTAWVRRPARLVRGTPEEGGAG